MTQRTPTQNRALHLWIRRLAEAMDDAGLDMRTTIKVPIRPTEENVKAEMVKPVMEALYPDIHSTADLSTSQIGELYEVMNRFTAEKLHISVPFPSEEEMRQEFLAKHGKPDFICRR